jgi:uncharacterized membrane protein YeaQ/YmgE (transglycosylase-associated protein family)
MAILPGFDRRAISAHAASAVVFDSRPARRPAYAHPLAGMLRCRPGAQFRRPVDEEVHVGLLHIIGMIIVGFIVGWLAQAFYPGAQSMGFWATAAIGIIGSLVGGLIGGFVWRAPDGKFHPAGFVLSIVGALVVLWLYLTFIAK